MTAVNVGTPRVGTLPVSELFGPTLQGEGPAAGRGALFLRLGGCNLSCSWCDSAYTWDGERFDLRAEITPRDANAIVQEARLLAGDVRVLVLTGGEPLLHQRNPAWMPLLDGLRQYGFQVHVETNGTVEPTAETRSRVTTFVVSPKLPHAGAHRGHQSPAMAEAWGWISRVTDAHMKVVVQTIEDIDRALDLAESMGWPRDRVWVMPEGTTAEVLATRWPWVAQQAAARGINASHRLHVLAWGDDRGH